MIPLLKPSPSFLAYIEVSKVLDSGWWGNGPKCLEFEASMVQRTGFDYCVTVNSATAALHLSLLALRIGPGDQVVLPALTFISTALAVSYTGATPVFADVDPETLCLDPESVSRVITHRTRAVIPVDYAGFPAGTKEVWNQWWQVHVVEDAAHAPLLPNHVGDPVCYSFHPVKPLASGDGGAILTNDEALASHLRALRWCGIDRDTWERSQLRYGWDYCIDEVGYKYHWNDIQAAIGLDQLSRFDYLSSKRSLLAYRYLKELRGCGIDLPKDHPDHVWHLFVVRTDPQKRNSLIDHLLSRGISAGVHYKPLTYYSPYSNYLTPPVTEKEWRRMVTLPLFSDMSYEEQDRVIEAVRTWALRNL